MDDEHIRIWSADSIGFNVEKSVPNSNMEYMRPYELTETEEATLLVNKFVDPIFLDKVSTMHQFFFSYTNAGVSTALRTN